MIRLSAFTDILERPFEETLDAFSGIGLPLVDLRSRLPGGGNVDAQDVPAARKLKAAVRARGLAVGCVASWGVNQLEGEYDPADRGHRERMWERVEGLAAVAAELGSPSVRVYSFKRPSGPVTEAHRRDNAEFLAELAGRCAARGVVLLVENEPPTLTATCAELGDLMRRARSPALKVNWDIVNGWRAGETPWRPGVFAQIAGHVGHVHVKGARAAPDGSFSTMAVPGEDDVPHAGLMAALRGSGFDGVVTIDPHYRQFADRDRLTGVPDPVLEVARRTARYLEPLIAPVLGS